MTGRTCATTGSPSAANLYEARHATAVVLWKGYDNPADILAAAAGTIECNEDLTTAAAT